MSGITLTIVTYNNAKIIGACLDSLMAGCFDKIPAPVELQVIDNQSQDATIAVLKDYAKKSAHPIKIYENSVNLGFGAAHNLALGTIASDYHIVCNPDIIINSQTISLLAAYMDKHPDIGILCPKLTNADGSLQPNNHRYPTVLDLGLRRLLPLGLQNLLKKRMDAYLMLDVGYENTLDVPFLSGAFMFCRTAVLKQVEGFDGRYFLYFEDADLCRKVHAAGYRTVYYPKASVVHQWERSAYKSLRMTLIMMASAIKYFNKWGYQWY